MRRLPQFATQYMLDKDKGSFNWPFLQVSPSPSHRIATVKTTFGE